MTTLYAGSLVGIAYFVSDLPGVGRWVLGPSAHQGFSGLITDPVQGIGIPFMLVGPLLAALCVGIYVVVSLNTPPMNQKAVLAVCWDHPFAFLRGRLQGVGDPRVVAAVLFVAVMCLYAIMH